MLWNVARASKIFQGGKPVNWLYLALNIFSVSIPLAFSFESKVKFYKNFRALFIGLFITAAFFIVWDYFFTAAGVWQFNPEYVLGIYLFNLPFEEWMFFIFIPYACVFIHESLKYYLPSTPLDRHGKPVAIILSLLCLVLVVVFNDRLYTTVTFGFLGLALAYESLIAKSSYLGRFFFTYIITLIPFSIVNGFLTSMPVLIYNNSENMNVRIGTIPLEDFFYSMLMIGMNVAIFERIRRKRAI